LRVIAIGCDTKLGIVSISTSNTFTGQLAWLTDEVTRNQYNEVRSSDWTWNLDFELGTAPRYLLFARECPGITFKHSERENEGKGERARCPRDANSLLNVLWLCDEPRYTTQRAGGERKGMKFPFSRYVVSELSL